MTTDEATDAFSLQYQFITILHNNLYGLQICLLVHTIKIHW